MIRAIYYSLSPVQFMLCLIPPRVSHKSNLHHPFSALTAKEILPFEVHQGLSALHRPQRCSMSSGQLTVLESKCLDLNLSSASYQHCNAGQVTWPLCFSVSSSLKGVMMIPISNDLSLLVGRIDGIHLFHPKNLEFSGCLISIGEWMNDNVVELQLLSHKTFPFQSQNMDERDINPWSFWFNQHSGLWKTFLLLNPCSLPSCTNFQPTPAAPLAVHKMSYPIVPVWLWFWCFHFLECPPLASVIWGLSFFGSGSAPVVSLFALTLNYGFSRRIPGSFYRLIDLWFNMYYLVYVFHWFLNIDSYPHPPNTHTFEHNILWTGMHMATAIWSTGSAFLP